MSYKNNEEPEFNVRTQLFEIIDTVKECLNEEDWTRLRSFINIKEKYIVDYMPKEDSAEIYVDGLLKHLL